MLQRFYPHAYVDSAYGIDFEKLYREGYRGVIFDIDNTLVPHGAPADRGAVDLFRRLKDRGYRVMLLSNTREPRVKSFASAVGAEYIHKAGKPGVGSYIRAMEQMHTDKSNTLFVGDQLFTDIWGANRAGIRTFLVRPVHPREEIQIVLKRLPERIVLFFYQRQLKKKG